MAGYNMEHKEVKWSLWSRYGREAGGFAEYKQVMEWMHNLKEGAEKGIETAPNEVSVYGRRMHDYTGKLLEIRLYRATYITRQELEAVRLTSPHDTFLYIEKQEA